MYTIIFQYPDSEKGKGYLRRGDDLYFYLPSTREFVYKNRKDNIGSTDARTDLFGRQKILAQYIASSAGTARVSKWDCDVVRLDAKVARRLVPGAEVVRAEERRAAGEGGELLRLGDAPGHLLLHRVQGPGKGQVPLHEAPRGQQPREGTADVPHQRRTSPRPPSPTTPSPRPTSRRSPDEAIVRTSRAAPAACSASRWCSCSRFLPPRTPRSRPRTCSTPRRSTRASSRARSRSRRRSWRRSSGETCCGTPPRRPPRISTGTASGDRFSGKAFVKVSVPDYGAAYLAYNFSKNLYQGPPAPSRAPRRSRPAPSQSAGDLFGASYPLAEFYFASTSRRRCSSGSATSSWPGGPRSIWTPVDFVNLQRADPLAALDLRVGKPGVRITVPMGISNVFLFADLSGTVTSGYRSTTRSTRPTSPPGGTSRSWVSSSP